jgi:hypothetical protein
MPPNILGRLIRLLYRGISTWQDLEVMETHFRLVDMKERAQYSSVLFQENEKAVSRIAWRERDSEKLATWLETTPLPGI